MRKALVVAALAAVAVVAGLVTLAQPGPFAPKPSGTEACVWRLTGTPGTGPWRVAVASSPTSVQNVALDDGRHVAVCEPGVNAPETGGWTASDAAFADSIPASPQPLTYDADSALNAEAGPGVAAGRVPAGTASVRVVKRGGSTFLADVGGGMWVAWLYERAVAVEALDASGAVIGRVADPAGLRPRSSLTPGRA